MYFRNICLQSITLLLWLVSISEILFLLIPSHNKVVVKCVNLHMMNLDDVRKDGVDPGEVLFQLGAAVHRGPDPISVLLQHGSQERTGIP